MKCLKCLKNIDNDSLYCKYCGLKIDDVEKIKQENDHLINIFNGINHSLYKNSRLSKDEFDEEFEAFKHFEERKLTDNDYYKIIVYVVFYSGFKASTVDKYKASIEKYFSHYNKVAEYDEKDIAVMMGDRQMIKNRRKIEACIYNANVIIDLIVKHGSIVNYIESFSPNNDVGLRKLYKDLIRKFKYISEITSYHILTRILA